MKRKHFIKSIFASSSILLFPKIGLSSSAENENFSLEEIKEFVFAAHKDLDKTRMIVDKNPLILNCANQAKRGDFETALGGASHMGRKDIADMLVARGARMDIFNLAFLGHAEVVKNLIQVNKQYLTAPGPHGFTLLHHAKVGKHEDLANWLMGKGLEETRFADVF